MNDGVGPCNAYLASNRLRPGEFEYATRKDARLTVSDVGLREEVASRISAPNLTKPGSNTQDVTVVSPRAAKSPPPEGSEAVLSTTEASGPRSLRMFKAYSMRCRCSLADL